MTLSSYGAYSLICPDFVSHLEDLSFRCCTVQEGPSFMDATALVNAIEDLVRKRFLLLSQQGQQEGGLSRKQWKDLQDQLKQTGIYMQSLFLLLGRQTSAAVCLSFLEDMFSWLDVRPYKGETSKRLKAARTKVQNFTLPFQHWDVLDKAGNSACRAFQRAMYDFGRGLSDEVGSRMIPDWWQPEEMVPLWLVLLVDCAAGVIGAGCEHAWLVGPSRENPPEEYREMNKVFGIRLDKGRSIEYVNAEYQGFLSLIALYRQFSTCKPEDGSQTQA